MLLEILRWPDPRLTTPCAPVTPSPEISRLAADMLETMYAAPGRGLAAPQVGQLLRMFVMDVVWKEGPAEPRVFLNPQILDRSASKAVMQEGCLSLPGFLIPVERPSEITLRWQDLEGLWHEEHLSGMAAICAQHEFDHLDGRLTIDRAAPEAVAEIEPALAALRRGEIWQPEPDQTDPNDPAADPGDVPSRTGGAA